jgi:hypothetical protein
MNKRRRRLILFSWTILFAAAAMSQSNPANLRVNIPFSFVAGDHTFPAGKYSVTGVGEKVLHIADSHNEGTYVLTFGVDATSFESSAKLIFYRYENSYFLIQVWGMSGRQGKQLFQSSAEKELARKGATKEIAVLRAIH